MRTEAAGDARREHRAGLHRYALFTAASTLFLIAAGGLVTSTGSGLAVPDWPLSYGTWMPPMVGGIFYEHGHRMVATFVGALTIGLVVWTLRSEPRRWVRRLSLLALGAVVLQGLLGGLTVLFLLPTPVSVSHACLGQTFFCLTVTIALVTSRGWREGVAPPRVAEEGVPLRWLAAATTGVLYVQLILGAFVRHTEAALAIPDFPLSFGRLLPPLSSLTADANAPYPVPVETLRARVMVQFAHRAWALVAAASVFWTLSRILRRPAGEAALVRPASLMTGLLLLQVVLGGAVVWTERAVFFSTAHVVVGASILATSLVLTLRLWRGARADAGASAAAGTRHAASEAPAV